MRVPYCFLDWRAFGDSVGGGQVHWQSALQWTRAASPRAEPVSECSFAMPTTFGGAWAQLRARGSPRNPFHRNDRRQSQIGLYKQGREPSQQDQREWLLPLTKQMTLVADLLRLVALPSRTALQRFQESDEVVPVLFGKIQIETGVVEVDGVHKCGRRAVMEVRRASRQAS